MRIGLLGSKGTTLDFLTGFEAATGHRITHLATLSEASRAAGAVAFYQAGALLEAAGDRVVHEVQAYNLTDPADLAFFEDARLDVLLVIGWERLIPDAVLRTLRFGAFGMHGSAYGLPRGRGRSPLNWSILQGHDRFVASLFRYTPGMDDGDVVGSLAFSIGDRDDVGILHMKGRVCMMRLLARHLPEILEGRAVYAPQPGEPPSFYPKRVPADGGIDWRRSTQHIDRLVRAVAPPYPGAFTGLAGQRLTIEAAQPFDMALFPADVAPGTVLDVSPAMDRIVVKTGDGSLLVTRMTGAAAGELAPGQILESEPTIWTRELLAERYGPNVPEAQWEIRPGGAGT